MKMKKIVPRTTGDVNENKIHTSSLEQVQKVINEASDLICDALVTANYINELEVQENHQSSAWLPVKYNPDEYFTAVPEPIDVYDVNKFGSTSGTVFPVVANGKTLLKINTLYDTGAMKSVMSLSMYNILKKQQMDKANLPHIVGASGKSLEL